MRIESKMTIFLIFFSKPANLEGLEVDQYIWSILNSIGANNDVEEVTMDSAASWRASKQASGFKVKYLHNCLNLDETN